MKMKGKKLREMEMKEEENDLLHETNVVAN